MTNILLLFHVFFYFNKSSKHKKLKKYHLNFARKPNNLLYLKKNFEMRKDNFCELYFIQVKTYKQTKKMEDKYIFYIRTQYVLVKLTSFKRELVIVSMYVLSKSYCII